MASIRPFRALRPTPDKASAVSSVPYDVVSTEEARQLADGNPLSFLRVTRSEMELPADTDPYSAQVYERAGQNLRELREKAPLVVDETPSLYLYRLRMGGHEQTGIAGCFSVDEYESDVIKKHERTRRDKEDDRTRHIIELRAQTGVVFLTYRAAPAVDAVATRVSSTAPLFDFKAADGVEHAIWRVDEENTKALVEAFGRIPALYIADGHHRAASAARARAELRGRGDANEADTFIAVAFPDNQMQVLPYNRTVKDLAGRTPEQFLAALRERFAVADGPADTAAQGGGHRCISAVAGTSSISSTAIPEDGSRASTLDVALLQRHVLEELLGIGDVRSDKRDRLRRWRARHEGAREGGGLGQGRRRVLDVPRDARRPDGDLRCRRHHAARSRPGSSRSCATGC